MKLNDLRKKLEKKMSMGSPPEYDRVLAELVLEACDEIRVLHNRLNEMDRKAALAKYGGCQCKHG